MKTLYSKNKCPFAFLREIWVIGPLLTLLFCSCENDLDVGLPQSQLTGVTVFQDVATAEAALAEVYFQLRDNSIVNGGTSGAGVIMGLYADELDYYGSPQEAVEQFYKHTLLATNTQVENLWDSSYSIIYKCNAILEGLAKSTALNLEEKEPLMGQAQFIRAYLHFYLVITFGDIPYIRSTDYRLNAKVTRMPKSEVYNNIVSDILEARTLLPEEDFTGENIYVAKGVATAFLARVYLFTEQWQAAADACNIVLEHGSYSLGNIDGVFIKNSSSTIWQLKPQAGNNTLEGKTYIFQSGPPPYVSLNPALINSFEPNDLRLQNWIGKVSVGANSWFYPYKYKLKQPTGTSEEYSILIRLAEIYLSRAEARIHMGNLNGAQQDINAIRLRAGLTTTTANSAEALLQAIAVERRREFFSEQGLRWFDLVRTGKASEILEPIKEAWEPTDVLLPIPMAELLINPNLLPQNPGY
ncbi:RagB/SusD family nutrient uptake outer membrane protein [Aequorivita viscosa]|nr:RagB/SusD family nutrient uptake outer membrane protein [Aequorivita viscosa]